MCEWLWGRLRGGFLAWADWRCEWRWASALLLGFALGIILVYGFGARWEETRDIVFGATMAAWVQAIGVFAAVFMSGWLASHEIAKQERRRQEAMVMGVVAVVEKAAAAVNDLGAAIILRREGLSARQPLAVLDAVRQALTPKRIHELPDYTLVSKAVDIVADIIELWSWISTNALVMDPGFRGSADALTPIVNRTKEDCIDFVVYARSNAWKKHS